MYEKNHFSLIYSETLQFKIFMVIGLVAGLVTW